MHEVGVVGLGGGVWGMHLKILQETMAKVLTFQELNYADTMPVDFLGPVSISDNMFYCKISWSLEAVRFFCLELFHRSEIWQAF